MLRILFNIQLNVYLWKFYMIFKISFFFQWPNSSELELLIRMTILLILTRLYMKLKSTKMKIFNTPFSLLPPKITMNVSTNLNINFRITGTGEKVSITTYNIACQLINSLISKKSQAHKISNRMLPNLHCWPDESRQRRRLKKSFLNGNETTKFWSYLCLSCAVFWKLLWSQFPKLSSTVMKFLKFWNFILSTIGYWWWWS